MPGGRPTVMTPEVVSKLEEGFTKGLNDLESCLFAGISKQTLYDYQHLHPEFVDRKEKLKKNVTMIAKMNIYDSILEKNQQDSKWYLERRAKDEFGTSTNINLGGQEDNPIIQKIERIIVDPAADTNA